MSLAEKELADRALMQVQALELTLLQMEERLPAHCRNLAEMGHMLLQQMRQLVGNPDYWEEKR